MSGTNKRKRDYANRWKQYKDTPPEFFFDHLYEDLMEWKVGGWELPPDVCCLIRTCHLETKKVTEYVYKRPKAADKKLLSLCKAKTAEITICTHDSQHLIGPYPSNLGPIDDVPFDF